MKSTLLLSLAIVVLFNGAQSRSMHQKVSNHASKHCQQVNAKVNEEVTKAEKSVPSIKYLVNELFVDDFEDPGLSQAEKVVAEYMKKSSGLVLSLESYYQDRATDYDDEEYHKLSSYHHTLASAVQNIVEAEVNFPLLSTIQSSLQSAFITDPSIVTYVRDSIEEQYPSIKSASSKISAEIIVNPYIVSEAISLDQAFLDSATLYADISSLSTQFYELPSTIDSELIAYVSNSRLVPPSVVKSLETCYPTVFTEASQIASYVKSHKTVLSDVKDFLSAAESVSSFGCAVENFIHVESPMIYSDLLEIHTVHSTWPSGLPTLSLEQMLVDSSSTLTAAVSVIQQSFYRSPQTAMSILEAIENPSIVTAPSKVKKEEASHESLVKAIRTEKKWISKHPQYHSMITHCASKVIDELTAHSNLVQVLSSLSEYKSPLVYRASKSISQARLAVPSLSSVIESFEYLETFAPSITCAESVIAHYDVTSPELVEQIWSVFTDPRSVTDIETVSREMASHADLMKAFDAIKSVEHKYSCLQSIQSALINAEKTDSSLLSQWSLYTSAASSIFQEIESYYPPSASSGYSYAIYTAYSYTFTYL